jgi:hypothetical protein
MLITIRSTWLLRLFGWQTIPSYVIASHKLWWRWIWQEPNTERQSEEPTKNLIDPNIGTGLIPIAQLVNLARTQNNPLGKKEAIMPNNKQLDLDEMATIEDSKQQNELSLEDDEDFYNDEDELLEQDAEDDGLAIPDDLVRDGETRYFQEEDNDPVTS